MAEKVYEFRKLKATDLFLVLKLVKKIGLNALTEAYYNGLDKVTEASKQKNSNDTDYAEIGIAMLGVAQIIVERIIDCENEIYNLLEATSNLTIDEIKDLDMQTFISMIADFVKQKEFTELFTQAVSLFNTAN